MKKQLLLILATGFCIGASAQGSGLEQNAAPVETTPWDYSRQAPHRPSVFERDRERNRIAELERQRERQRVAQIERERERVRLAQIERQRERDRGRAYGSRNRDRDGDGYANRYDREPDNPYRR